MPDLVAASSNTARATRKWTKQIRPYALLFGLVLATVSPAAAALVATTLGVLAWSMVGLAGAIRSAAFATRGATLAVRTARSAPSWITLLVVVLFTILGTVLVMRWLDSRRKNVERTAMAA